MASQTAYLSPLDQYMPRIPVVIYLVFATSDVPSALAALQSGLDKMTDHLPFLRGFVSVPSSSHPGVATTSTTTTTTNTFENKQQKGRIAITYSPNDDARLTLLHLQDSLVLPPVSPSPVTSSETGAGTGEGEGEGQCTSSSNSNLNSNKFTTLQTARFPPSLFRNTFTGLLNARREALGLLSGKGDPAFAASYAVIEGGGLVVGVAAHHALVDGTGMAELVKFWGVCTLACTPTPPGGGGRGGDGEKEEEKELKSELELNLGRNTWIPRGGGDEVLRRGQLLWDGVREKEKEGDRRGWEELLERVRGLKVREENDEGSSPIPIPVPVPLPKGGTKLFGFDGEKLERARPKLKEASGWDEKALSVNNILCSIMWACITRARAARHGGKLDRPTSKLGFAINGRRQLGREFSDRPYLGNVNIFGLPELDASALTDIGATCHAEGDLACLLPVIEGIYGEIQRVTADHIGDVMSLMEQAPDITKVEPNWVRSHGADLSATSWANMGIYESDFGPLLGKPQFMRVPAFDSDGLVIIMPRRRPSEQGVAEIIEVAAILNAEDLAALEGDDIWKSWLAC